MQCVEGTNFQDFRFHDVGFRFSQVIHDLERGKFSFYAPYEFTVGVRWDQDEADYQSFWRRTPGRQARGGLYTSAGPRHPEVRPVSGDGSIPGRYGSDEEAANRATLMFYRTNGDSPHTVIEVLSGILSSLGLSVRSAGLRRESRRSPGTVPGARRRRLKRAFTWKYGAPSSLIDTRSCRDRRITPSCLTERRPPFVTLGGTSTLGEGIALDAEGSRASATVADGAGVAATAGDPEPEGCGRESADAGRKRRRAMAPSTCRVPGAVCSDRVRVR